MVDLFDEISEDMRHERTLALLRRYGGLFLVLAVLGVLGVAAQQVWLAHRTKQAQAAAVSYFDLTRQADNLPAGASAQQQIADADQLRRFAASAPAGYRTLAGLRAAALYEAAGQSGTADAVWDQISRDPEADPLLRQLADLLWAQHAFGRAADDAIFARLAPLTAPENAWHGLARETQALLYLREGKTAQAKALLGQLTADPSAPEGVRDRADGLLAQLNG